MIDSTPRVRIDELRSIFKTFDWPTPQTVQRFDEVISRFERFARNSEGIETIDQVTVDSVANFVRAKGHTGDPSLATMHVRRTNLRLLFRIARQEFQYKIDPTQDVALPPRSVLTSRPLTSEEVALGRSYSLHDYSSTRWSAAWTLGEASAVTAELANITIDDLDLGNSNGPRVWLHGSRKRIDRWATLDDWQATQLEKRASSLHNTRHLIYQGKGREYVGQASCCNALRDTFIRAGLDAEQDVRPNSLAAWAGTMALEETGTIEGVALRLGIRSLDAAAEFINYTWR